MGAHVRRQHCILCHDEFVWHIARFGDQAVTVSCSRHLATVLINLIRPMNDGRTLFRIIHFSEV